MTVDTVTVDAVTVGTATVRGVYRYPVKSMLGEDLASCPVGSSGLLGDRAYALLDAEDGTVASAKVPRKWAGLLAFRARFLEEPDDGGDVPPVAVTFPDGTVHRSDDPGISSALSDALGRRVRLVAEPPPDKAFEEVWPDVEGLAPREFVESVTVGREPNGDALSRIPLAQLAPPSTFFDLSVLHVLTTATLDRLRALAPGATFDVRRYRPNLLLETAGGDGFPENDWVGATLAVGSLRATVSMPTMRCVMTTLPQEGLGSDPATLRAVARHNRLEIANLGTWACAGAYADVTSAGTVRRGDAVTVRREEAAAPA